MRERPKIKCYCGLSPTAKQLQFLRDAGFAEMPRTQPEASRLIQQHLDDIRHDYAIDPYEFCF